MRRFLSALLVFAISQIAHTSCPDGFDLVSNGECRGYNGMVYFPPHSAVNTAITNCNGHHAQPVIIHNEERCQFGYGFGYPIHSPHFQYQSMKARREQQAYWKGRTYNYLILGLVCNTWTSQWEWSDGSNVDYKPANGNYDYDLDKKCNTGCTWYIANRYWTYDCGTTIWPFDIYCTAQLPPLPVPSPDGCESFEDDNEDGVCYQIGTTAESWQEAQKICRHFGADLASIHNVQENSFVRRLAVSKGAVSGLFLGATLSGKGNQYGWIDGSEWDYSNFYPGFPVNGLGDCVAMDTQGTTGQWMNTNCNSNYSVACVRQQRPAPSCLSGPWKEGDIITSPGFPFDASIPCDFFLIVDEGKRAKVEITLEANSCCDRLVINDNLMGGNVVAKLSGELLKQTYTTNGSNLMRVSWQPNGAVNVRGLRADLVPTWSAQQLSVVDEVRSLMGTAQQLSVVDEVRRSVVDAQHRPLGAERCLSERGE